VKSVNAHFSDDILSALLNEPIPGHGVFWSSVGGKSYPIPLRVLSFEQAYKALDPTYTKPAATTYASVLKTKFGAAIAAAHAVVPTAIVGEVAVAEGGADEPTDDDETAVGESFGFEGGGEIETPEAVEAPADVYAMYTSAAIRKVAADKALLEKLKTEKGVPWMGVQTPLKEALPDILDDRERNDIAFKLVTRFLDEVFGKGKWRTDRRTKVSGVGTTAWIVVVQQ
jgi:hypothetical protein